MSAAKCQLNAVLPIFFILLNLHQTAKNYSVKRSCFALIRDNYCLIKEDFRRIFLKSELMDLIALNGSAE